MGIKDLFPFIKKNAPNSFRETKVNFYTNQTVAYDAYNVIYQFVVQTTNNIGNSYMSTLSDKEGNPTGHLLGILNRIILMSEHKVKCIWVFDGKPPQLKLDELRTRKMNKQKAAMQQEEAKETGNVQDQVKFQKRNVGITKVMKEDAQKMIRLLGMPVIEAEAEAESQCVMLVNEGKADAVASEDLDCLTFGSKVLLRNFKNAKENIVEIVLEDVLSELDLTMDQFIDFCILCGCDYVTRIGGFGSTSAYNAIKKYGTIEEVVKMIELKNEEYMKEKGKTRYTMPPKERFRYIDARKEFKNPPVKKMEDMKIEFRKIQKDELIHFLVEEKGFNIDTLNSKLLRLEKAKNKKPQSTLESFFGKPKSNKKKPLPKSRAKGKKGSNAAQAFAARMKTVATASSGENSQKLKAKSTKKASNPKTKSSQLSQEKQAIAESQQDEFQDTQEKEDDNQMKMPRRLKKVSETTEQ